MDNQLSKQELEEYWAGLQMLMDLAEGDNSIVESTIDDILEHTPATLQELREGLSNQDNPKVQLSAHSLKSSMLLVGAQHLSSLCQQVELAAKNNQMAEVPQLGQQIFAEFDRLKQALQVWKQQNAQ